MLIVLLSPGALLCIEGLAPRGEISAKAQPCAPGVLATRWKLYWNSLSRALAISRPWPMASLWGGLLGQPPPLSKTPPAFSYWGDVQLKVRLNVIQAAPWNRVSILGCSVGAGYRETSIPGRRALRSPVLMVRLLCLSPTLLARTSMIGRR